MFSGIVEELGKVERVISSGGNIDFWISASFLHELKIDQSVAHNGACLTVVELKSDAYRVTAIEETLNKTSLRSLKEGDEVNLERCLRLNDRLDGHMVQGHVDTTASCVSKIMRDGSWKFFFTYTGDETMVTVPKGSVCIDGVSLTVVDSSREDFSVCIIPYTHEHTTFRNLKPGQKVNLEFDVIGKYVMRFLSLQNNS